MHKLSLLLVTCLCTLPAIAQWASFGLKAGASFYTVKTDTLDGFSLHYRTGFHGGIYYKEVFNEQFGFQMEMLYSAEGVNLKKDDRRITLSYSYLTYPLLMQWHIAGGFFLETGPQIGFLLNAKESERGYPPNSISLFTRSYACAWAAGAGYFLDDAGLGVRYNAGLTRLTKEASDGNRKSKGFQVSFSWRMLKFKRPFRGLLSTNQPDRSNDKDSFPINPFRV